MGDRCQVCGSAETSVFFELKCMPVLIGTLWPSADEAKSTRTGDMQLVYCPECSFIWNRTFDPQLLNYSQTYENSLHFSDLFQEYSQELVARLVDTYDIRNKNVIDIGCGKGDFLAMLCEQGDNRGVGFDPSYAGDRITGPVQERLTFHQDLFSEKYTDLDADLLTSRFVFEHVTQPIEFLQLILAGLGRDTDAVLYFEVPNTRVILEDLLVWDIIYEHCSYFGIESLAAAFQRAGFETLDLRETWGGQFVSIDARYGGNDSRQWGDVQQVTRRVEKFASEFRGRITDWRKRLDSLRQHRKRVVAWGAGAKAVSFLNMLEIGDDDLPYVVDINPHKQGTFLGGTGQAVVPPEFLVEYRPDVIILMNPNYQDEIAGQVSGLGLSVEYMTA